MHTEDGSHDDMRTEIENECANDRRQWLQKNQMNGVAQEYIRESMNSIEKTWHILNNSQKGTPEYQKALIDVVHTAADELFIYNEMNYGFIYQDFEKADIINAVIEE